MRHLENLFQNENFVYTIYVLPVVLPSIFFTFDYRLIIFVKEVKINPDLKNNNH